MKKNKDKIVTFITGCALCDLDLQCTRNHSQDKWYRKKITNKKTINAMKAARRGEVVMIESIDDLNDDSRVTREKHKDDYVSRVIREVMEKHKGLLDKLK